VEVGGVRGQEVLCFVLTLVKCTKINFSGANNAPCYLAHSKQHLWIACSVEQFTSIYILKARAIMVLIKPVPKIGRVRDLQVLTWLVLELTNKISNSSKPCGMSVEVRKVLVL
jgi:hypothetical protein